MGTLLVCILDRTLTRLSRPEHDQPHVAEYMSAVGGAGFDGTLAAMYVVSVFEDWKLKAAGNFEIERWIQRANVKGELYDVEHLLLIETPANTVLDLHRLLPAPRKAPRRKRIGTRASRRGTEA